MSPPPERLGRYVLAGVLGKGAMGTVYRGWDPELDRHVAIKVIQSAELEPAVLKRFKREAQALARLTHPHIVGVYDIGNDHGAPFIVMELVEGVSLAHAIRQQIAYAVADKLRMTADVCGALECAHAADIVHRDVKPANILMTRDGRAKLADFGVALLHDPGSSGSFHVVGTPAYMAPEACAGREVDARADIYGLAATLYEWLCGSRPHSARDAVGMLALAVNCDAPDIRTHWPDCPPALALCLRRGLARSPDDRFQRAAQFGAVLRGLSSADIPPSMNEDQPTVLTPPVELSPSNDLRSEPIEIHREPTGEHRERVGLAALLIAGVAGIALLMVALGTKQGPGPARMEAPVSPQEAPATNANVSVPSVTLQSAERSLHPGPTRGPARRAAPAPADIEKPAPALTRKQLEGDVEDDAPAIVPFVPIGTKILATIVTPLRTDRSVAGQEFRATVADSIVWNGREVVPVDAEPGASSTPWSSVGRGRRPRCNSRSPSSA